MFKTDKKSLEKLSFGFNEKEIANLSKILKYLEYNDLLTVSQKELERMFKGLEEIGKLKLDGKIYAFHVSDSYAARQGDGEGVELFLRQGDNLETYFQHGDRDYVYQVDSAIEFLKEEKRSKIYTGQIPHGSAFLDLPHECDEEDPLVRNILNESEIGEFESNGIEVVKLEKLI